MLESPLRTKIQKYLKSEGAYLYHPHGAGAAISGVPDILACYRGVFLGLEVKVPGKGPTELQSHTLREIAAAGGVSAVVYSVDDARDIIHRVDSDLAGGNRQAESLTKARQTSRSGQ